MERCRPVDCCCSSVLVALCITIGGRVLIASGGRRCRGRGGGGQEEWHAAGRQGEARRRRVRAGRRHIFFFFCSHCLTCSCRPATRGTELFAPFRLSYFFAEYLVLTLGKCFVECAAKRTRQTCLCLKGVRQVSFSERTLGKRFAEF